MILLRNEKVKLSYQLNEKKKMNMMNYYKYHDYNIYYNGNIHALVYQQEDEFVVCRVLIVEYVQGQPHFFVLAQPLSMDADAKQELVDKHRAFFIE